MKDRIAAIIAVSALAVVIWQSLGDRDTKPTANTPFTTFERRIRSECWGEGAQRIRHQDFEATRDALTWMQAQWPKIEGESFRPLDEEEAACGQDLDALAALWERWSK